MNGLQLSAAALAFRHEDFFWAAIFLAPVCVLLWIAIVKNYLDRFSKYTVSVPATVIDVQAKRYNRSKNYHITYLAEYEGHEYELTDVGKSALFPQRIGSVCQVRIDPEELTDCFIPRVYWIKMIMLLPIMLLITIAAFSGLTS